MVGATRIDLLVFLWRVIIERGYIGSIEYLAYGAGKLLVALHGFADDAEIFTEIEGYRVVSVSLPWHGKSTWQGDFTASDLEKIIEKILQKENTKRLVLLGFSMGGRIALCLAVRLMARLDGLILMAPDGVATHWLYDTALLGRSGKRLIKRLFTRHLKTVFAVANWAYHRGLLSKFLYDFGYNHLSTAERRERLFRTWEFLGHFKPNLKQFARLANTYRLPVKVFLGRRDQVIRPETARFFERKVVGAQVIWLDKGHLLVQSACRYGLKL